MMRIHFYHTLPSTKKNRTKNEGIRIEIGDIIVKESLVLVFP